MSNKTLDAYLINEYTPANSNEKKNAYTRVGRVVFHKEGGGLTFHVTPGMTVYGDVVCYPSKEKAKSNESSNGQEDANSNDQSQ